VHSETSEHRIVSTALADTPLRTLREAPIFVFLLTLAAVCLDYSLAPALNSVNPALACGLLLLLLLLHRPSGFGLGEAGSNPRVAGRRILVFSLLHLAVVLGIIWLSRRMTERMHSVNSPGAALVAAAKYLILLPTILLLPRSGWRRFDQVYRSEWVAACVLLFTFFPYRIFSEAWPWYSQMLGHLVHTLAHPFVSGLGQVPQPAPTIFGPRLDVVIGFDCNGLAGVKLFQVIFCVLLVLEWSTLNRRRALIGYFGGLVAMLGANVVRITLLVIIGNRFSPDLAVRYHVNAGWVFFTGSVLVYLLLVHNWLSLPRTAAIRQK